MRVILATLAAILAVTPVAAGPPNVVVILSDDQGFGDLSLTGNANLKTPHVDSLARDGAYFPHFTVQPVCSPTRAEFLTGRWHPRGGVFGVTTGGERLDLDEATIAQAFRNAGYATGCFGKWHNGTQYPYHPNGRGFSEYYGFTSGHWGEYFSPPLDHNGQDVRGDGYTTDDFTSKAIAFLTANAAAQKPSFCYLALNTPHSPMQVPDADWARFQDKELAQVGGPGEDLNHTRAALAMCENIDANVGRLLAALKTNKLDRDTIVVYFSDNGPNGHRWNAGLKGIKAGTDEGGVRSPLLVRWPGHVAAGGVFPGVAAAVDLYPTLISLAGIPRAGDKPFDGVSLAPVLLGKSKALPDRVVFHHWNGKVSARDARFRLDAAGKLYDLTTDPGQSKNVAAEHPADATRLADAVADYRRDVLGNRPGKGESRPFTVGYEAFPRTLLPARDGVPSGGVKRSAPAPNCSFFTNVTPAGRMTWDIEVHTAGAYRAVVHYTCTPAAAGAKLELAAAGTTWSATVAEAHDPPVRGREADRVPRRGESYVKDFAPLELGSAQLAAGRLALTLRATELPGGAGVDVRAVELVLVK